MRLSKRHFFALLDKARGEPEVIPERNINWWEKTHFVVVRSNGGFADGREAKTIWKLRRIICSVRASGLDEAVSLYRRWLAEWKSATQPAAAGGGE